MEFDADGAPDKPTIVQYFKENLKPFIKVKMEQQNQAFINFEDRVQKTVNAEAKAGLQSSAIVWNADSRYSRSYCASNSIASKV